jgi:hypothetical protein
MRAVFIETTRSLPITAQRRARSMAARVAAVEREAAFPMLSQVRGAIRARAHVLMRSFMRLPERVVVPELLRTYVLYANSSTARRMEWCNRNSQCGLCKAAVPR